MNKNIKNIKEIANKIGLGEDNICCYGKYMAKIEPKNKIGKSKLIVVTSVNPTPAGEGKTTLSIGLIDAMNKAGYKTIGALREPSLGPVFGMKGTATGGGATSLFPANIINLHFTGDFHAITTANNLISSVIDNEIFQKSNLDIDSKKIVWKRCLDMNDRSLRKITLNINESNSYDTGFNITAASDLMALFCLSNSFEEFKKRMEDITVAFSKKNILIKIKDLEIIDAIVEILEEAFKPNLVQTLEGNPVIIHGGPFANIAHGCNSIIATKTAMSLADYVITECGFGADLGLEKFMDIKCRNANLFPNLIVVCATIKSLIMHGEYEDKNGDHITLGFKNLLVHLRHIEQYGIKPLVILNINKIDTKEQIMKFINNANKNAIDFELSNMYENGSANTSDISTKVINMINNYKENFLYDLEDSIELKAKKIAEKAYGLSKVIFSKEALKQIKENENIINKFCVCIAKTPNSLTSDAKQLNYPSDGQISIESITINYAAKLLVLNTNKIIKMPGLPKIPKAKNFKC